MTKFVHSVNKVRRWYWLVFLDLTAIVPGGIRGWLILEHLRETIIREICWRMSLVSLSTTKLLRMDAVEKLQGKETMLLLFEVGLYCNKLNWELLFFEMHCNSLHRYRCLFFKDRDCQSKWIFDSGLLFRKDAPIHIIVGFQQKIAWTVKS